MTSAQLVRAVAHATGESPATVRRLGFSPEGHKIPDGGEPQTTQCPSCGLRVIDPGVDRRGSPRLAECRPCDLYFVPRP
jgi:hypothetical protein